MIYYCGFYFLSGLFIFDLFCYFSDVHLSAFFLILCAFYFDLYLLCVPAFNLLFLHEHVVFSQFRTPEKDEEKSQGKMMLMDQTIWF